MDLASYVARQKEWSERTFGPGRRTAGIISHIRKEIDEVSKDPDDIFEWIDIIILALDGAWRAGLSPEEIESSTIRLDDLDGIPEQYRSAKQSAFRLHAIENLLIRMEREKCLYANVWQFIIENAIYGAWHLDWTAKQIEAALVAKQEKNLKREWPDWREFSQDQAIEHVRDDAESIIGR